MTHLYIDLPPIETFMNISTKNRKEHLFKVIFLNIIGDKYSVHARFCKRF